VHKKYVIYSRTTPLILVVLLYINLTLSLYKLSLTYGTFSLNSLEPMPKHLLKCIEFEDENDNCDD